MTSKRPLILMRIEYAKKSRQLNSALANGIRAYSFWRNVEKYWRRKLSEELTKPVIVKSGTHCGVREGDA